MSDFIWYFMSFTLMSANFPDLDRFNKNNVNGGISSVFMFSSLGTHSCEVYIV